MALFSMALLMGTLAARRAEAQTFTTLYSFAGPIADGAVPQSALIMDSGGNLYGTTAYGGANRTGAVFEVTPLGEMLVYSFGPSRSDDGEAPVGSLIADAAGNLYGTTSSGGQYDAGTVFVVVSGVERVLYSFTGAGDGANPYAGLLMDAAGNLYGTTVEGGPNNYGIVFKLTPPSSGTSWTETVLHSFAGGSDGANPYAGLLMDASGNLYGTTVFGGQNGDGTVFQLTPSSSGTSWTETVLHSFAGGSDGANPYAGLIMDAAGNLYGTTSGIVANGGGTVFELTPSTTASGITFWTEAVLYSFTGGSGGANPSAGLVMDAAGNLYGTTVFGGQNGDGTVFQLTPSSSGTSWTEMVLHSFAGDSGGASPNASLIADNNNLYGTTAGGGASNNGTVFKLTLPASFNGVPGKPNCVGQSISFLATKYGGIAHAATALGQPTVTALKNYVGLYCGE